MAERSRTYLLEASAQLADICFTSNNRRAHFNHRLAIPATSLAELEAQLTEFVAERDLPAQGIVEAGTKPRIAFLFTGHGSQYVNMGRTLFETSPVFQEAVRECEVLLHRYLDIPISAMMYPEEGTEKATASLWDGMKYTQPAQFVLAYALTKLWASWGIEPGAVIGHSVGEYAAACAAGMMNLADGIKLVAARGRLMDALPQKGVMAAVFADEDTVTKAIAPYAEQVAIAVINGPTNIVISGNAQAIEAIQADLTKQEIKSRRLDVAQASHSPFVDPMLDEFEDIAATITYHQANIEYISSLTSELTTRIDSKYWRTHQRQAVRFGDALQTLLAQGYDHLIEIGPTPTLIAIVQRNLDDAENLPSSYSSLRKGQDDWGQMLNSLAGLYVHGAAIDWRGFDRPYSRRHVFLPTYPFQRQSYWLSRERKPHRSLSGDSLHPLLGTRLHSATREIIFENELSSQQPAFLGDHIVHGQAIMPATAYVEILLAAAQQILPIKDGPFSIEDLIIHVPIQLPETETTTVQTIVSQKTEHELTTQIFSRDKATGQWHLHVSAVVRSTAESPSIIALAEIQARCTHAILPEQHYQRLAERSIRYGTTFRGVYKLGLGKNEAIARIEVPEEISQEVASYRLHPALLDAALQAMAGLLPDGNKAYLPFSMDSVKVFGHIESGVWSHASIKISDHADNNILTANVSVFDDDGKLLVSFDGFSMKHAVHTEVDSWLYEVKWRKAGKKTIAANELVALLQPSLASMLEEADLISYHQEFLPHLEALCGVIVQNALIQMGWSFEPGTMLSFDEISKRLGVVKQHQLLLKRLLEILEEEGAIAQHGNTWKVMRPLEAKDVAAQAERLRSDYPEAKIEVGMVERIGLEFGTAMQGKLDPLELLFPKGSLTETEKLYQEALFTRSFNQLMGNAVREFVRSWNKDRPLRILEIGAGTGGTTSHVISQLSGTQVEYIFTDISPLFLNKARQKFASYDFLHYQALDIEQDPAAQGFKSHHYDLILATNVLHATSDLHATLGLVNKLLVPGGLLLAIENTRKQRFADLIVGLTPGWWAFRDRELRPSYALLSQSQWLQVLKETNFASARGITGQAVMSNQSLLIAQTEDAPAISMPNVGKWLLFGNRQTFSSQLIEKLRSQGQAVKSCIPG